MASTFHRSTSRPTRRTIHSSLDVALDTGQRWHTGGSRVWHVNVMKATIDYDVFLSTCVCVCVCVSTWVVWSVYARVSVSVCLMTPLAVARCRRLMSAADCVTPDCCNNNNHNAWRLLLRNYDNHNQHTTADHANNVINIINSLLDLRHCAALSVTVTSARIL